MRIILEISWVLTKLITYSATSYKLNLKSSSWHTIGSGKLLTPHDETPSNFVTPAAQNGGKKKRTDAKGYNADWGIVLIFLFVLLVQFFTFLSPVLRSEKLKVSPWAPLLCSFWLCLANGRQ